MAGTIQKRGDRTWLVRVFLGRDANGKVKHFNKTIHGTKKDAQKFLNAKLREKDLGTFVEPSNSSLGEHLDYWLKNVARTRVRESTARSYEQVARSYLIPDLGHVKLHELRPHVIQSCYRSLQDRGFSARTVRYAHSVLSGSLRYAEKQGMISANPCRKCELPRSKKKEMNCLMPDQVRVFLKEARNDRYAAAFLLAIETGMRPSEYLALKWTDLDFEKKSLAVRRTLQWRKGGGHYFEDPKTKSGRRSITISDRLISTLRQHRVEQLQERLSLGPDYNNENLVFSTSIGTPVNLKNLRNRHFFKVLERCGIKRIRLVDLRHTTATLLLVEGVNPKIVSERLGHASVVITLDTYSHVLPTMQEEATVRLANLISQ